MQEVALVARKLRWATLYAGCREEQQRYWRKKKGG
jgi:hypothetical protein